MAVSGAASGRVWLVACSAGSLLIGSAHAQENRVAIAARILETYDTNPLRGADGSREQARDNLAIAPGVTVDINRNFARQRLYLLGDAGYVFNSRFRFLDRETINLTGGAQLRFGPRCQVNPAATFYRAQSDQEDLGVVSANTATIRDYVVGIGCPRPAGFFPTASASLQRTSNSRRPERNQSIDEGRIGIVWRRPSLGEAELFGQAFEISRNRLLPAAGGARDRTQVVSGGVRLGRNVGTRIAAEVVAAYTSANPGPGVRSFSGLTYNGTLRYAPAPRLSFSTGVGRALSGRSNVGTSYFIITNAELKVRARFSSRTSAGAGIDIAKRQFRGEDSVFTGRPRGSDRRYTLNADISYDVARPIVLELSTRYRRRNAENDIYDYSSLATTLSASIRL